jgi:hypothetical protein
MSIRSVPHSGFDRFIAMDWSGAAHRYNGIAVAVCRAGRSAPVLVEPREAHWTREQVADWLEGQLRGGLRLLIAFDFAFAFPFEPGNGYLGGHARGVDDIFTLWSLIETRSRNEADFGCRTFLSDRNCGSLFWMAGQQPQRWVERKRRTEHKCAESTGTRPDSLYKLLGPKQVGKASITGIRMLHRIRSRCGHRVSIWPFETVHASAIVEIYPTLFRKLATNSIAKIRSQAALDEALAKLASDSMRGGPERNLSDHQTDALLSAAGLRWIAGNPDMWRHEELTLPVVRREGWIFGVMQ